jgi:DNA-binding response OmpR family regulator
MNATARVMTVGGDDIERHLLTAYLAAGGLEVIDVAGGAELLLLLDRNMPDLVVLDTQVPDKDALELTTDIRAHDRQIGIIMLSAAADIANRVRGLDAGADDFVAKPFTPRELRARIRSVLRRLRSAERFAMPSRVRFGRCMVDFDRHELQDDVATEHLTDGDFALLCAFAANPYRPLESEYLMRVTGPGAMLSRPIAGRIDALRRRIENDPAHPVVIRTVAGVGYMFAPACA